jgi:hypothetical protein
LADDDRSASAYPDPGARVNDRAGAQYDSMSERIND